MEQLAQRAFVRITVTFIQTEATDSFSDGVRAREVKQHLLLEGNRTLNALNQALNFEAAKALAGPPARLREPNGEPAMASQPTDHRRMLTVRVHGHLGRKCRGAV